MHYRRAEDDERRHALSVLLTGRAGGREPAIDHFQHYAQQQGLDIDELWIACRAHRIAAAALLIPCQGRTGMLFVSPSEGWLDRAAVVELIRHLCRTPTAKRLRLIQSLLEPAQHTTQRVLAQAGFDELAVLLYMQRSARASREPLHLQEQGFRMLHWAPEHREAFGRAILASYEQTRDCPALRGVRDTDDIIAGHMAAGTFHPELWHAVYDDDAPVGVMLLNEAAQGDALELVYLGLSVPYRGRGVARRLVEHALGTAHAWGHARLMLAVDQNNRPAITLYRKLGFETTARRQAMIRIIGQRHD